jgi:plasmid stability protein
MPALTIKGIPDEVYRKLKAAAERHRRSLNSEAIVCLERSLSGEREDPGEVIADLRRWHRRMAEGPRLTEAFLRKARREGRR